jgi:UPF0755 protein
MHGTHSFRSPRRWRRILGMLAAGLIAVLLLFLLGYASLFGPPDKYATTKQFTVSPDEPFEQVVSQLKQYGFIKNEWAFHLAYIKERGGSLKLRPGGYELSGSMDAWTIAEVLGRKPYYAWVSIKPGLRKEQIADILADDLSWTNEQKQEWILIDTASPAEQVEGVYFGDTYLIPSDQSPAEVAKTLRNRFTDAFAPYAVQAAKKGIPWTDVINMASLIEREAAKNDKALVAGILWNRIEDHMPLQVDATLQYVRGVPGNWWPMPRSEDKQLVSDFNTYKHAGLPPHPIANPSLASIDAAINPTKTNCIFYLHDHDGVIHCSPTYAGQLANVRKYLK